ncbi:DUF805 domain-containing protein [Aurantiacibacter rhizosphaerae]|uniref:DUF805 domain-containing protein n=1 Tax=Aurantiacibacter rhizosphaerae TaxID=2691582 RepID=A0A844X9M6_9SPHN|nr:DUF805 domain-containing protein [Aurantiacibacter rhizosphaerae]MWV27047.1 DUF805 domain-containing protein [Aurantiacibacter rhizosphaerae]
MAFSADDSSRISRSGYWKHFFINVVAVLLLIGVAFGSLASGAWVFAIIAVLLIVPVGIYFRVVMMRRCRDIGWPPALPWITFGLGVVGGMFNFEGYARMDMDVLLGGSALSSLVSLLDFALMITLGSVRGRDGANYAQVFGEGPAQANMRTGPRAASDFGAPAPSVATGDGDAMDDAIARAVENYRRTGSAVPNLTQANAPSRSTPRAAPPSRATGFGRKMI